MFAQGPSIKLDALKNDWEDHTPSPRLALKAPRANPLKPEAMATLRDMEVVEDSEAGSIHQDAEDSEAAMTPTTPSSKTAGRRMSLPDITSYQEEVSHTCSSSHHTFQPPSHRAQ